MDKPEYNGQRRTVLRIAVLLGFLGLLVFGISSCSFPDIGELLPITSPTEALLESQPSPTPQPTATPDIPLIQPRTLILWIPPEFEPIDGSISSDLFTSRLDEFIARRPQTEIQVRVKPLTGDYGMLNSLRLTDAAAPILMPDLVALPRALMEEAYEDGLVVPLDEYTDSLTENDWFDYALELAVIDDEIAGIPFAGDMMVLAFKNDNGELPPTDWNSVLTTGKALSFPASDPRALISLALYQSLGGAFRDEEGNILLDGDPMLEVLSYYQAAQAANVMPYWLTQFETDEQAWNSYLERQSTLAITWTSRVLSSESSNTGMAAMPTKDGIGFSYSDGWVWCVVPSDSDTEAFAVELVEFLTEPSYLNTWALEGGYLPVRTSGLENWSETAYYTTLSQLLPFAVLVPETEIQSDIGQDVREAVVSVLKDQVEAAASLEVLLGKFQE